MQYLYEKKIDTLVADFSSQIKQKAFNDTEYGYILLALTKKEVRNVMLFSDINDLEFKIIPSAHQLLLMFSER